MIVSINNFIKKFCFYFSTIPTLRKLDKFIFGDPTIFRSEGKGNEEIHVDREMNVWGAGGAHSTYFKVIDQVIIKLFNKPIDEQGKLNDLLYTNLNHIIINIFKKVIPIKV